MGLVWLVSVTLVALALYAIAREGSRSGSAIFILYIGLVFWLLSSLLAWLWGWWPLAGAIAWLVVGFWVLVVLINVFGNVPQRIPRRPPSAPPGPVGRSQTTDGRESWTPAVRTTLTSGVLDGLCTWEQCRLCAKGKAYHRWS